jgi:hypothetical protein
MTAFWIGVASHDHVRAGVEGGFCQLAHGKAALGARLQPDDRIVYYSPRELTAGGAPVQAFTAIGEVLAEKPHQLDVGGGFKPYRLCGSSMRRWRRYGRCCNGSPLPGTKSPGAWRSGAVFSASRWMITDKSPRQWVSRTRKLF